MRLKRIKLAGFKSFVEPTSVSLPHDLIGVVGPNGCGKSNIIDAVRWVMGEISAKLLRGDSMEDVIFNGSSSRKPVGKAFVELIFDNSSGRVQGPYAKYTEINVRREVSRDGNSKYFLNKSRVRRRDVMDLFLGTGLGPRSYSIIEQGMVNRVVESRPEELRLFVEEAAGISKYKERRKETESRIKRTRENLDRIEDIRQELDKQLQRLKRQSRTAERYKELKQKERQLKAQLAAIRWLEIGDQLEVHKKTLFQLETGLEAAIAKQREKETLIEETRQQQTEATNLFNTEQAAFYDVSANIARLEQSIKHEREKQEDHQRQKEGLERTIAGILAHIESDTALVQRHTDALAGYRQSQRGMEQQFNSVHENIGKVETLLQETSDKLGKSEQEAAARKRDREVHQVRLREVENRLERRGKSETRLGGEFQQLTELLDKSGLSALKEELETSQTLHEAARKSQDAILEEIARNRNQSGEISAELATLREERQALKGRLDSLVEIQKAESDAGSEGWADRQGFEESGRLFRQLKVESGWEAAVDAILGRAMQAWCTDDLATMLEKAADSSDSVALFRSGKQGETRAEGLLAKIVASPVDMQPILTGVGLAETMDEAIRMAGNLKPGETVVTRDGAVFGSNWGLLPGESSAGGNVLARQAQIEELLRRASTLDEEIERMAENHRATRTSLNELEKKASDAGKQTQEASARLSTLQQSFSREETLHEQNQSRLERLNADLTELRAQIAQDNQLLAELRVQQTDYVDSAANDKIIADLSEQRGKLQIKQKKLRDEEARLRENLHKIELDQREIQTAFEAATGNIQRLQDQLGDLDVRKQQFVLDVTDSANPLDELQQTLESRLNERVSAQEKLDSARNRVSELDANLRNAEQQRHEAEIAVQAMREKLEKSKMLHQELTVRRETMVENMAEHGVIPEEVCQTLPANVSVDTMSKEVAEVSSRIIKLGAINLAAIDEYEEQKERKIHIDSQYDDLVRALELLEDSIRKINRETRTQFKETFDAINTSFKQFFPRLFGGGHATLELTGDDMLDAGVTVMARPPGKRNSTIHLLSGGEKALTAVSLVFAIFELNPAPFCLLDEVDAPLDDANVHRYTKILNDLSEHSQLIFITHNKITMEAADILVGVTMGEPGVSRLVAVDIDQAVEIAAQAV